MTTSCAATGSPTRRGELVCYPLGKLREGDGTNMIKKINLLFLYHAGANCQYFETMLKLLDSRDDFSYAIIRPNQINDVNLSDYDVLVYQTFPDNLNSKKYNTKVIAELDEILSQFVGYKILLDSFDMGSRNGFERFGVALPRIKHVPSYDYLKKFNVISIICTTGWIQEPLYMVPPEIERSIPIHCAFTTGVYPHKRRECIMNTLSGFFTSVSFARIPVRGYNDFLRTVKISVVAGGFGETSGSAYPALRAGALLFVHEDIKKVKLLPFAELVDGEDYVSFNETNFINKLEWMLVADEMRDKIRLSGQQKFREGFNPGRSAKEFLDYLNLHI